MDLVQRVKDITLNPAQTWPIIESEAATPKSLFVPYLLILAAIPALATFIGTTVFGMGLFGINIRIPFASGLGAAITSYVLSLVMIGFLGWLISALAPSFGGKSDLVSGLKCAVYSYTPALVAGIFNLIPALMVVGLLAALYSLYVLYLGLPVLMKNPKEKTILYMVVLILAAIVSSILISFVARGFMPSSPMGAGFGMGGMGEGTISAPAGDIKISGADGNSGAGDSAMTIKTDKGEVKIDMQAGTASGAGTMVIKTPDGEVTIDAKKMEEFAKQMEALSAKQPKQ
jgi:Yip1 domain